MQILEKDLKKYKGISDNEFNLVRKVFIEYGI